MHESRWKLVGLLSPPRTSAVQFFASLVLSVILDLLVTPVINEDITLELYELLELYCELLIARFGLLDQKYGSLSISRVYFSKLMTVLVTLIPELTKAYVASFMQLQGSK